MGRTAIACCVCLLGISCKAEDDYPFPGGGGGTDAPPAIDAPSGDGANPDGSIGPEPEGTAPQIVLVEPMPGALIAGLLQLELEVTDDVAVASVSATIAGMHQITLTPGGGDRWSGTFDTLSLAGLVAPGIVVRAKDSDGVQTELGFVITLDNQPPFAALDPPNVRIARDGAMGSLECSVDFDPLGNDAPDDGESVAQLIELRARVVDVGNNGTVTSTLFVPHALIGSVDLYVFDDTTKPLVVDTNGDGVCDNINPTVVPAIVPMLANEAAVLTLVDIPPTGEAHFATDTFNGSNSVCSAGTDAQPPPRLCDGEAATVVIGTQDEHQIFGIPPVSENNCLGFAFDARANNISDGFACAALLVTDALGNRSVSAPLRICINSDGAGAECLPYGSIAPAASRPNCTGTVTGGTVTTTPCNPRVFFPGINNDFELVRDE